MREIDSLLVAPTTRSTSFPPLKRIKVGMPLMPYRCAVEVLSSTFTFTTPALSPNCSAIASMVGASMRQGAHHAAQKSTSTGLLDCSTSFSKELSVTSETFSLILNLLYPDSLLVRTGTAACQLLNVSLKSLPCLLALSFNETLQHARSRRMAKL